MNIIECTICFEKKLQDEMMKTKCNHIFCSTCLNYWLKKNITCPICRQIVYKFDNEIIKLLESINFKMNEINIIMNNINIINNDFEYFINNNYE